MAPALTEPISHRQSKISSPAQASSPRPIISDVTDQTQTTTATAAATNPHHHRLATQQNGGAVVVSLNDNFTTTKDTAVYTAAANQFLDEQLQQPSPQHEQNQEQQSPKKTIQLFKSDQHQPFNAPDFQSIFAQQIQTSNGPSIGPSSFDTHMDQQNDDQSIVTDKQYEQQQQQQQQNDVQAANDLLNAIVDGTQASNQLDCGINAMDNSNIE